MATSVGINIQVTGATWEEIRAATEAEVERFATTIPPAKRYIQYQSLQFDQMNPGHYIAQVYLMLTDG